LCLSQLNDFASQIIVVIIVVIACGTLRLLPQPRNSLFSLELILLLSLKACISAGRTLFVLLSSFALLNFLLPFLLLLLALLLVQLLDSAGNQLTMWK